ncbi:MAG: helix-turn-helix transcriptional regulator [Oscillospiraceae bacterium]|nr:helix-turn-helix transcriptional regulator [Oscillospiraceae bacterium]
MASQQAIYHWQRGTCLPTVDHLCALSHLFNVPMDDILILKDTNKHHHPNTLYFAKAFPLMAM